VSRKDARVAVGDLPKHIGTVPRNGLRRAARAYAAISISMYPEDHELLQRLSRKLGINRSALVRSAVRMLGKEHGL